jgi:hypothetical protein
MAQFLSQKELMNIIGSWNKEGFHGHNRSKPRNEFSTQFRLSARPSPPEKFKIRLKTSATKHIFSEHDNRQAFLNDPELFSKGLGKKKIDTLNKNRWNPEFIAWEHESGRGAVAKNTLYQRDFCHMTGPSRLLQNRLRTEATQVSSYKDAFSHGEPNARTCREIKSEISSRFEYQGRAKTCAPKERMSVASCMNWTVAAPVAAKLETAIAVV